MDENKGGTGHHTGYDLQPSKTCSDRVTKQVRKRFPILSWLPGYKVSDLAADIIAGTTVGLTVVPQSMAYAAIAGLSPEYGLYSSYIGCFLYVLLGSCRQVTIGPTAVMGLLIYETCGNNFPECTVLTAFYGGVFELLMAVLQLGWVVSFISESVVIGFTAGAATTIMSSQVKNFLGISGEKGTGFLGYWKAIIRDFSSISMGDCCMGITSFLVLHLLRRLKEYKHPKASNKKLMESGCWLLSVSRNAIIVVITSFIAYIWETPPFILTGHVHGGFPDIGIPQFRLPYNSSRPSTMQFGPNETLSFWESWSLIGAGPLIVALVAVLQNVAISKAFGSGQTVDATQEMFALGSANIVGSFFSSISISGSFSRSAVNESSGVRSTMGGLFTGILVLLSLGFLTPYFYYIPKASLAAVIICAVMLMIEFESLPVIWKVNKMDAVTCGVTYICCIMIGLEYGIMVGVITSISVLLIKQLRLQLISEIVFDDHWVGTKYLHVKPGESSGVNFPSVDYIRTSLIKLSRQHDEIKVIILSLEKWHVFDYTSVTGIVSLVKVFRKEGKSLILSNVSSQWESALGAAGLSSDVLLSDQTIHDYFKKLGGFENVHDSVEAVAPDKGKSHVYLSVNTDKDENYENMEEVTDAVQIQTPTDKITKTL